MKTLLFALLILSPAAARADVVFKCRSAGPAEDLSATIRFDERGRDGRLEADRWTGYPPTPLVYAELKGPVSRDGRAVYSSGLDPNSGARADVALPLSFLKDADFRATLTLVQPRVRPLDIPLACERF
jgi:hypothetical protein